MTYDRTSSFTMQHSDDYLVPKPNHNYLGEVVIAPTIEASSTTSFDETCQTDGDYYPTAIQKLAFSSCIGGDSTMIWPSEEIDNELDEFNKTIETNIEFIQRDAVSLIDSLREALSKSQEQNILLKNALEQVENQLHQTRHELHLLRPSESHKESIMDTQDELSSLLLDDYDAAFSLTAESPQVVHRIPPNLGDDKEDEILQLQNEISIQNQYIQSMSEKSVQQTEELQLAQERIRLLEYRILQEEEKIREDEEAISFQREVIGKQQDYISRLKKKGKRGGEKK